MATESKTKTESTVKKQESSPPKADKEKAETAQTDTSAATGETDGSTSGGAKKSTTPSRPISYFSSVSSDEYRSGWDDIFSKGKTRPILKIKQSRNGKKTKGLPTNINIEVDDLDLPTRKALEGIFRAHAKKKRLNYDKLSSNGQIDWTISCRISSK